MRESNFSFAVQSRASVVISSQLYDRRALDSTSPLPLSNSLTHLTYLTSTSPRIREILTLDGGLERLVRLLREFCARPPPPRKPRAIYGLLPPPKSQSNHAGKSSTSTSDPTVSPLQSFDRQAAIRFSLAFQCVVNIGVRGSESVRSRVVQAGMLDVVSAVLECWLVSKGFAVCPSPTGSGAPRESKEVRVQRRLELLERRQRDGNAVPAAELARALSGLPAQTREHHDSTSITVTSRTQRGNQDQSSGTPASASQDQSRFESSQDEGQSLQRRDTLRALDSGRVNPSSSSTAPLPIPHRRSSNGTPSTSGNVSEDTSANVTPAGGNTPTGSITVSSRERSGTVVARPMWDSDQSQAPRQSRRNSTSRPSTSTSRNHDTDDDIITEPEQESEDNRNNEHPTRMAVIIQPDPPEGSMDMILDQGTEGINLQGVGMGVEQGIVNLDIQTNDDLAMGAPPGAPGAVPVARHTEHTPASPPGATTTSPTTVNPGAATPRASDDLTPRVPIRPLASGTPQQPQATPRDLVSPTTVPPATRPTQTISPEQLALHAFTSTAGMSSAGVDNEQSGGPYREEDVLLSLQLLAYLSKYPHVRQAFYKPRVPLGPPLYPLRRPSTSNVSGSSNPLSNPIPHAPNVFSLVERFTFRPSPSEIQLPRLPSEIQYWAGVIMRNACRKDETRGGIRQCANMVCGKWESFPREFAKCRRCRKAKYCGKECQSKAWADGHRFWCSSRDAEANTTAEATHGSHNSDTRGPQDPDAVTVARAIAATRARHRHTQNNAGATPTATNLGTTATGHGHRNQNPPTATTGTVQRSQPPLTHNVIVRVGGPQVTRNIVIPNAGATQFDLQQLQVTLPTVIPRQRILQHAVAPDSMEIDRQPAPESRTMGMTSPHSNGRAAAAPSTDDNATTSSGNVIHSSSLRANNGGESTGVYESDPGQESRTQSADGMVLG